MNTHNPLVTRRTIALTAVTSAIILFLVSGTLVNLPTFQETPDRNTTTTQTTATTPTTVQQQVALDPIKFILERTDKQLLFEHVRILASEEFQGRLSGDEGQYKAADYIAARFTEYGLKPAGNQRSYLQNFTMPFFKLQPPTLVSIALSNGSLSVASDQFNVFLYSGSVNATTEIVFAGYGITLPQLSYDDYAGINATGKFVLAFRHGPREDATWERQYGVWTFGYKATNARIHGAIGMILVNDYRHDPRPSTGTLSPQNHNPNFAAVWLHRGIAESVLTERRLSLETLQNTIDQNLQPSSVELGVSVTLQVRAVYDPNRLSMNVLGMIQGVDEPFRDELIVISAHYDHLGVGVGGRIYYGADDDASGTSVVLEAARVLSEVSRFAPLKRSILFVAWSGEEEGLLGSRFYTFNPVFPLEKIVAVLQMDMVGVGDNSIDAYGVSSFSSLFEALMWAQDKTGFLVNPLPQTALSDHYPFVLRGVPAILLSTSGNHPFYHTPQDTFDTISPDLLQSTAKLVALAVWLLAGNISSESMGSQIILVLNLVARTEFG